MENRRIFKTWSWSEVAPDGTYTIREATRYLGIHRCTIYAYIADKQRPLPFIKSAENSRLLFRGADLIAYKAAGLPKRGRKLKNHSC